MSLLQSPTTLVCSTTSPKTTLSRPNISSRLHTFTEADKVYNYLTKGDVYEIVPESAVSKWNRSFGCILMAIVSAREKNGSLCNYIILEVEFYLKLPMCKQLLHKTAVNNISSKQKRVYSSEKCLLLIKGN